MAAVELTPGKELLHAKLDIEALQDVSRLLQTENARLRQMLHDAQVEHGFRLQQMVESKAHLETDVAELRVELEHSRSERSRLEAELIEAVNERRRQAQVVHDVKRQVDGRLSKLVEELHRRDEEVHKLEYVNRERERALERLHSIEVGAAAKGDALAKAQERTASLQNELTTSQQEVSALRTEVRFLKDRLHSSQSDAQTASQLLSGEVQSILPMYRQWAAAMERAWVELEDLVEHISDDVIDSDFFLRHGIDNVAAIPDRKRLAAMKKLDRDRMQAQQLLAAQIAANSDNDSVALTAQAIRHSCDAAQYTSGKCRSAANQLRELVNSLRATARQQRDMVSSHIANGTSLGFAASPLSHSGPNPAAAATADFSASIAVSHEVGTLKATVQHLREALTVKEKMYAEANAALLDIQNKLHSAESTVKRLELDVSRKERECESAMKMHAAAEAEAAKLREELVEVRGQSRLDREATLASTRDVDAKHQSAVLLLQAEHDKQIAALRREGDEKLRSLEQSVAELRRDVGERNAREERMRAALEESRQKRLALKRQREELVEELQDLRSTVASQAKEIKAFDDATKALTAELERTKAALDFEVRQTDDAHAIAAADATLFDEWKAHRSAPSSTSRSIVSVSKIVPSGGHRLRR